MIVLIILLLIFILLLLLYIKYKNKQTCNVLYIISGGGKLKLVFIGTIPCNNVPENASWKLFKTPKYNSHYNKYGIREFKTKGVGFTFPFIDFYLNNLLKEQADVYFLLYKPWADRFKIIDKYKKNILYTDLSDYGKHITDDIKSKISNADLIYIDIRTLEFLLPTSETHKYMIHDDVLNESVYSKSYEREFITFFGEYLSTTGYVMSDECSGLIPYRKLGEPKLERPHTDYFNKPLHINTNGHPERISKYPEWLNNAFVISRLCYPNVYSFVDIFE